MGLDSQISEANYELLQKEALQPSWSLPRGEIMRDTLNQSGSICGTGISVGFGVLFDCSSCRYEIGNRVHIGAFSVLGGERGGPSVIEIEDDVSIGAFFSITVRMNGMSSDSDSHRVTIKSSVLIEPRVTIASGITIGKDVFIHRGAIVIGNVPDYAVVSGCPAQIIGYRKEQVNERAAWNGQETKTIYGTES